MKGLSDAIILAVGAHRGQKDLNGEPYILHPLRVMQMVPADETHRIVAVLHDVVEDSEFQLRHLLEAGFSSTVVDAVDALTRRGKDGQGESYVEYIERCAKDPIARVVKMADLHDNSRPEREPRSGMLRRNKKALAYLEAVAEVHKAEGAS